MTFDFYSYGAKGTSLVFQSRDSLFIVYIAHEGVWVSTNSPKPAELLVAQVSTGIKPYNTYYPNNYVFPVAVPVSNNF